MKPLIAFDFVPPGLIPTPSTMDQTSHSTIQTAPN
eukprot:gene6513-biopygen13714